VDVSVKLRCGVVCELIGFDARLRGEFYLPLEWSPERRASFLLDPSVAWPLSVDHWVWPSLFEDAAASRLRRDQLAHLLIPQDLRDYRQQGIGLWSSVSAMKAAVAGAGAMERSICVAIELCTARGLDRDPDWRDRLGGVALPSPAEVNWRRAGFDVADIGYISGVSNCGWSEEQEEVSRRARWAPLVNQHGLLGDLGVALDFRAEMDDRAPEHSPFFVYRIALCEWDEVV
jgi:hypothetical protein